MPEQLWFTEILNRMFAGPVTSLLRTINIEPKHPTAPIPNSLSMELLVFAFLLLLFVLLRSRLSVDSPGSLQHVFEGVEGFIQGQSNEIIGHHSEGYTPFLAALFFFILACNLIGVIPGFESPTAVAVVPLGCALCAFVYYQTQGFKHAGIAYLFAGDMVTWVFFSLVPLGVPILFLGLHIGVSLLQTYIFVLLTTVYLQ